MNLPMALCSFETARFRRDRRGVVALLVGLAAPVLVMAVGMGIEISRWSATKVELQRIADAAALAGAFDYQHQLTTSGQTAASDAKNAALAADYLALINYSAQFNSSGGTGSANNWISPTLTDTNIIVSIIPGIINAGDIAVQVTVSRPVPLFLAAIFTAATTQKVSATAIAELVAKSTGSACLLALQGDLTGITTDQDVNASNGGHIATQGCAVRSDGDANLTGGVSISGNVIAAGTVSINNGASISSPFTATSNAGQIGDPLLNESALQTALQNAAHATGPNDSCTSSGQSACSLTHGNFTGISVSNGAPLTIAPGLYLVNGPVNFGGGSVTIQPGGVTIVSTGPITIGNGVTVNGLNAAATGTNAGTTGGAIPGVVLATSSASSSAAQFNGGASFVYSGVIYVPNGTVSISNGVSATTPGCAEVIANDINLSGGATFASNACVQDFGTGLPNIPDQLTTTATLVQ